MKKFLLLCGVALLGMSHASAQEFYGLGNRVGISVGAGLTGITIDAATCLTPYVGVRAGVDYFPNVKVDTDLDVEIDGETRQYFGKLGSLNGFDGNLPKQIEVQGKTSMTTGHILFDIHPFKTGFRITAGAYFGGSEIISVYNKEPGSMANIAAYNAKLADGSLQTPNVDGQKLPLSQFSKVGVALGDYFLSPKSDGSMDATLEVSSFRPYLGIGFGHAVPKKRLGVQFDLGVQFWGSPKVYLDGDNGRDQLTEEDADGDGGDAIKTLSKITVYPCMTLRITGRIL